MWRTAVLVAVAPVLITLCLILWRTPFPLSEGVSLIEDVVRNPPARFLVPDTSYYRPLFHITLATAWRQAASPEAALGWIKLLHIVPVSALVLLFVWHLRPGTAIDAATAVVAASVLAGAPAFRDNLEIPLSYTTVGMPIAMLAWIVLEGRARPWHGPALILLLAVAVGFKEQGLVLVPVILAAWLLRAPGVRWGTALAVTVFAAAYVAFRLAHREAWPLFQQDVGYGFAKLSPDEAAARFGSFPLWIFAYSGAATIANVLFSEPTAGVFSVLQGIVSGRPGALDVLNLVSSMAMTGLIAWWIVRAWHSPPAGLPPEEQDAVWRDRRASVVLAVALAACGVLSFDYSRDRLGGMAIVFYAIAAYHAIRAAAMRTLDASPARFRAAAAALLVLAGAWQVRMLGTLEYARDTAFKNRREWITGMASRRTEFADRAVYRQVMERLEPQGAADSAPQPTRYRRTAARLVRGR